MLSEFSSLCSLDVGVCAVGVAHASFMPSKFASPWSSRSVGSISMVLTMESSTAPVGRFAWGYEIMSGTRVRQS